MGSRSPAGAARTLLLGATLAAGGLIGCDNPACVFGPNGCQGGVPNPTNDNPAEIPANHTWLSTASPTITDFFPRTTAGAIHPDTPVAVIFSESMSAATLQTSILLRDAAGFGQPVATQPGVLVGDGRVLLLLPLQSLELGVTYQIFYTDTAVVTDLQGTAVTQPIDKVIGSFTVATAAPATPRVLTTWPPNLAKNQSGTGEIVVVFDRRADPTTVNTSSFVVKTGGVPPQPNPEPQPLTIGGVLPDTRVYRYRSVDSEGEAVNLGTGKTIKVELSPVLHKIKMQDGSTLPLTPFEYVIASFAAPLSAELVSFPTDAIGIEHISGPTTLDLAVTLEDGQVGDRLAMFVIGKSTGANPELFALFRDVVLNTAGTLVHLGELELDLGSTGSQARFADGQIAIALRLQRGNLSSAVRLTDVDFDRSGVQHPILDTTRPTLIGLSTAGTDKVNFRSDQRHLALIGRASEKLRSVEVSAAGMNNGVLPPVVGSTTGGLFVAGPVLLDIVDPNLLPMRFDAQIYDQALNSAAAPISGKLTQLGASGGPGVPPLPGPSVEVEVFGANDLAHVVNARVLVHQEIGGTVTPVPGGVGVTTASGKVTLPASLSGETLVTVDAAGFDLFTVHGVASSRISIPLTRSTLSAGVLAGTVSTSSQGLTTVDRRVADSRLFATDEPLVTVQGCFPIGIGNYTCAFGPRPIRAGMVGAASFLGADYPLSELGYNALSFLLGFQFLVPVAPAAPNGPSNVTFSIASLLNETGLDPEERAIDGPALILDAIGTTGLDLTQLDGDPRVLVHAQVRGLPGAASVGLGVPFSLGSGTDQWKIRCAYPGSVDGIDDSVLPNGPFDKLGKFVIEGTIDPDLRLFCELRDKDLLGNPRGRAGRRVRFSIAGAVLRPQSVPTLQPFPVPGHTGGSSYDLVFDNVIPDAGGQTGLYRATLVSGTTGRRWTLHRRDADDASGSTRAIHVPELASLGGNPLPDGAILGSVAAYAWRGFDDALFLWSDIEREFDRFAESGQVLFQQP